MKKVLAILIINSFFLNQMIDKCYAQTNFQWAKHWGGLGTVIQSVRVDASGNVYTLGSFNGTIDVDPGPSVNYLTTNTLGLYISKLDPTGNFIWAIQIQNAEGKSMAIDAIGNVYFTGRFYGTVDFDPGIGTSNLTCISGEVMFVCKLDFAGNYVWARQMGGAGEVHGYSIALDNSNNVYTTGDFSGVADFDPGIAVNNLSTSGVGVENVFLSKLDASGNYVWARRMGSNVGSPSLGLSIAIDAIGNVITTGYFTDTIDCDPGIGISNLISNGSIDIFISKLNDSGNFIWAKQIGGDIYGSGNTISVDALSNIYVSGFFSGTSDFDPGTGVFHLTSNYDGFITKLNTNGDFIWAKQMGLTIINYNYRIHHKTDAIGNVFISGQFGGVVDFDLGAGVTNLSSIDSSDIFISKLDGSGNFIWAKQIGGPFYDVCTSITTDGYGNIYAGGVFGGIVDFDMGSGVVNLTSNDSLDAFVLKIGSSPSSILEETNDLNIMVYPNPINNGEFTLYLNQDLNMVITDALGKIILKKDCFIGSNKIKLNNAPLGVYYLHLTGEMGSKMYKLILN